MQHLWKLDLSWDDPIPIDSQEQWTNIFSDMKQALSSQFPRRIDINNDSILHAFCDASNLAYGVAIYITTNNQTNLLIGKARVAPLKSKSIPRLELLAATLAARLVRYVLDAYCDEYKPIEIYVWCDNQAVLRWITSTKPLEVFVKIRVDEIRELLPEFRQK